MPFGKTKCPLATLKAKAVRTPAPGGGSKTFDVKLRVTKVGDPNDGKAWGEKAKCDAFATFKTLAPGKYRVTAEISADAPYGFDIADAVEVDLVKKDPPMEVTIPIRPVTIATLTPAAAWKQYINLQLTAYEESQGCTLVPHDVQEVRAAAALIAANGSGMQEWIDVATRLNNDAAGKRMDPKQMGRVLEVEATISPKREGVKVYFAIEADGGNPAWAGAEDDMRAAVSVSTGAKPKWKVKYATDQYAKTDANGVAKAKMRLTRFGGDKFKAVASLHEDPMNNGSNVKSAEITAWRKIWYQASYNKDYPLYSLAQAQADFAQCFVDLEEIDTRPYTVGAGGGAATEQDAWQYDSGARAARIDPNQTVKVEVVVKSGAVGGLPATGNVKVKETSPGAAEIVRKVAVRKPAALSVTEADVTVASKAVAETFAPLTHTFRVRNGGDQKLAYTVGKTQTWTKLSRAAGTVAGSANEAVDVVLDGVALSNLAAGTYVETITFTNANKNTETATKTITVTVTPNAEGALTASPVEGMTLLGQAGGPFTGSTNGTYTLVNNGAKKLSYSVSKSSVPWLTVDYQGKRDALAASHAANEEEKKAKEKIEPLEKEATRLEEDAKAKENKKSDVDREEDAKVKKASDEAVDLRGKATTAREEANRLQGEVVTARKDLATAQKLVHTPEARGRAEQAQDDLDQAEERANEADGAATEKERLATESEQRHETAKQEATRAKEEAERAATDARKAADNKKQEAEDAKKDAEDKKQKAAVAKDRADKGIADLAPGASATIDFVVIPVEAAKVGALPASETITFKDETNNKTQTRTVKLAKPPVLTVNGANGAKTKQAGTFDATSSVFALKNDGGADLVYAVTSDKPWVTFDSSGGTLTPAQSLNVTATVNLDAANTFEVGDHTAAITIRDATNNVDTAKEIKLTVTANAAGVMAVLPWDEMESLGAAGGPYAPLTRVYTVKNIGGAALSMKVEQDQAWIKTSSPGKKIAIGDHNKMQLQGLRQQPAAQRPPTIQLLVCQAQCDPEDTQAIGFSVNKLRAKLTHTQVKNANGRRIEVQNPSIDGQPIIVAGTWEWDGHTGNLVGHDDWIQVERGRGSTSEVVLTLPNACSADCTKAGCAFGEPVVPTNAKKVTVAGLELHGYRSFLGEGGYQDRPTCLIVAKDGNVADFNDTVSHEIGHMLMGVLHEEADHKKDVTDIEDGLKETNKDIKKAKKKGKSTNKLDNRKAAYERALVKRKGNHHYYWPPGVPVHPQQYDDGQGNHCHEGSADLGGGKWGAGTCILYASGLDTKLAWCADCKKQFKFVDMRRFALSEGG